MGFEKLPIYSAKQQPDSEREARLALAMERTAVMLDCYPDRADVPNAGIYTGTLAAILAAYPESVILAVTDPVRGVQTKCLYRPKAAEIKSACEAEMEPIRRETERRRRFESSSHLLAGPKLERPSIEEIKAKLGPDYGISRTGSRPTPPTETWPETEARLKAEAADMVIRASPQLLKVMEERGTREKERHQ